jgi:hypothetical protein
MPIAVVCPHCHAQSNAPDQAAGRTARCPKCAGGFTVPPFSAPPLVAGVETVPSGPPAADREPWYYAYL